MDCSVSTVDIRNLLERHNIHWKLSPDVNILGGPNGSGKSTVLRAICDAFSELSNISQMSALPLDSIYIEIENGSHKTRYFRKPQSKKDNEKSDITKGWDGKDYKNPDPESSDNKLSLPDDFKAIYINSADQIASNASLFIQESSLQDKSNLTYLDLLIERELNRYNQLFTQHTQKVFQTPEDFRAPVLFRLKELFDKFADSLRHFMPDYKIADMSSLKFERDDREDGFEHPFSFTCLSTGEKQLVYLLLTVTNTLESPTLLLLDEADLGMHIDWKKILLRELRAINPNMQIIAATHSPSLIEGWYSNVREIKELYKD